MVAENLRNIRSKINSVCLRIGRNPEEIGLIAVIKSVDPEKILEAYNAGQRDFAENYVQELRQKQEKITAGDIHWHFIGHLQTNKVKNLIDSVSLIHSVDSFHLAAEIERQASKRNRHVDVLVEVHTTDETTKSGVSPEGVLPLVEQISQLQHVHITGLMTIGPFIPDPETARPCFRRLRQLKEEIEKRQFAGVHLRHLSMGMTNDFEIAIEEGATLLRLGTAIFGLRP
jgi:pyridoxal phosphate enzyme (YggS family)